MPSAHIMQLPFTTPKEILDWEARYLKNLSENRHGLEQTVIGFRESVSERGYLLEVELREMVHWKDHRLPSKLDTNPPGRIEDVTGEAFHLDDDWQKIKKLKKIDGVAEPVASVILHLYDPDPKKYPILDKHALRSIGIDSRKVKYDEPFWRKYVNFCSTEAKHYGVEMRTLDRALYKLSKADAASILKIMPEEMLLTELTRRGYDLSSLLRDLDETQTRTGEIVTIG